jgi:hypothetical protein
MRAPARALAPTCSCRRPPCRGQLKTWPQARTHCLTQTTHDPSHHWRTPSQAFAPLAQAINASITNATANATLLPVPHPSSAAAPRAMSVAAQLLAAALAAVLLA